MGRGSTVGGGERPLWAEMSRGSEGSEGHEGIRPGLREGPQKCQQPVGVPRV